MSFNMSVALKDIIRKALLCCFTLDRQKQFQRVTSYTTYYRQMNLIVSSCLEIVRIVIQTYVQKIEIVFLFALTIADVKPDRTPTIL